MLWEINTRAGGPAQSNRRAVLEASPFEQHSEAFVCSQDQWLGGSSSLSSPSASRMSIRRMGGDIRRHGLVGRAIAISGVDIFRFFQVNPSEVASYPSLAAAVPHNFGRKTLLVRRLHAVVESVDPLGGRGNEGDVGDSLRSWLRHSRGNVAGGCPRMFPIPVSTPAELDLCGDLGCVD